MNISEPFIRRPIGTSLLMVGLLVFGVGAYNLLPVAAVPNVDFPTITVTAQYPGANPSTMASSMHVARLNSDGDSSSLPASTLAKSRISLISDSRCWPAALMSSIYSACFSLS